MWLDVEVDGIDGCHCCVSHSLFVCDIATAELHESQFCLDFIVLVAELLSVALIANRVQISEEKFVFLLHYKLN